MFRPLLLLLSFLLSTATIQAQTFTFQHRTEPTKSVIQAGQRIKVFARDATGSRVKYSGKLENISNEKLVIQSKHGRQLVPMASIEEIRYRSPFMEKFTRFCLFAGLALLTVFFVGAAVLFLPALGSESASNALQKLPPVGIAGAVILGVALIAGIASKQWISEPATKWTVESVGRSVP